MILIHAAFNPKKVAIHWRAVIDDDRDTIVAIDQSGAFGIQFRNGERFERIALTEEAAMALYAALGRAMDHLDIEVRA